MSFKKGDFVRIKVMRNVEERDAARVGGYAAMWWHCMDRARGRVGVILGDTSYSNTVEVLYTMDDTNVGKDAFNTGWLIKIKDPRSEVTDDTAALLGFPFEETLKKKKLGELTSEIDRTEKEVVEQCKKLRRLTEDALK